jgi:hypothetical protein
MTFNNTVRVIRVRRFLKIDLGFSGTIRRIKDSLGFNKNSKL